MKMLPFSQEEIAALSAQHATPFYIYDEAGIKAQVEKLLAAMAWNPDFKEYYAVKALPNPAILKIMKEAGCGVDCSSMAELVLASQGGFKGEDIMFTSNDTPASEFVEAKKLGAILNLDDIEHLDYLETNAGLPELICFRYSPLRAGNSIIGDAKEVKFGIPREKLFEGYKRAKAKGIKRFGLHTMPISNELRAEYFVDAAKEVFTLAHEIEQEVGIEFEFINLGGGIGIPYKPDQTAFDLEVFSKGLQSAYTEAFGDRHVRLSLECGRFITGPFGYLVTTVRHVKDSYKQIVGLDACMANLMRPALYGSYHHITVLGKENVATDHTYDVVGSLCENNDKFAIDRQLPEVMPNDLLVIHDAGAHGHAMGFNYNGKLRSAEFLMTPDHSFKMIRRAETLDDLFATIVTD